MRFSGELRLCHRESTKNPAEMTGMRLKHRIDETDIEMELTSRQLRANKEH